MGLFNFFKKRQTNTSDNKKVEGSSINKNNEQPAEANINDVDLDEVIEQELEVGDFGGAKPSLTLRKSGRVYLIVEVPPFYNGDGSEIDGDEDFPEVYEFENLISEYVGVPVNRDDREVFRIDNPQPDTLAKVKEFIENYWSHRKEQYKRK
jgi:hypothetical protein